jgi:hypothetical protein
VVVDARAQLDFFDLDDFLLFASLVLFLLLFIFILAEIENLADGRVGVRRYLDEIETSIGGHGERFVAPDDSHHVAALIDKAHAQNADLVVDAGPLAGGGEV